MKNKMYTTSVINQILIHNLKIVCFRFDLKILRTSFFEKRKNYDANKECLVNDENWTSIGRSLIFEI